MKIFSYLIYKSKIDKIYFFLTSPVILLIQSLLVMLRTMDDHRKLIINKKVNKLKVIDI